tara:strand:- start:576 stop:770 length:195 start_codon:yes stop_codon:yes gene_type:complete
MSGDAIECLKCNERFFDARPWEEVEKQLCFYCDNNDKEQTIVLSEEMLEDCGCSECLEIIKKLK